MNILDILILKFQCVYLPYICLFVICKMFNLFAYSDIDNIDLKLKFPHGSIFF